MDKTKFLDKYDKEFVNIMIEIQNRIENFSKVNKLKINSWAKSLCLPTNNIAWKKNRNLYAIKLLDNILNEKLEKPFTKYAEEGEKLPMLDPILVKSQLTNKVKEVIENGHPDIQIQNFIDSNFKFIEPSLYDNYAINNSNINNNINTNINPMPISMPIPIKHSKTPKRVKNSKIFNNKKNIIKNSKTNDTDIINNNNFGSFDYDNNESNNINNYNFGRNTNMNEIDNEQFYKGDQLLKKNYFNFNDKLSKEPGFYMKTNPHSFEAEKSKLHSTIIFLQNETKIKNQIINQQDLDIQQLKKRISELEKKIKNVFK